MKYLGIWLLILMTLSCKKGENNNDNTWLNKQEYTLNYDNNWQPQKVDWQKIEMVYYYTNSSNSFQDNINVMIENISDTMTLNQYAEFSKNSLDQIPNSKLFEYKELTLNGKPAYYIDFEMEYNQKMQRNLQYYIVANSKAYVITFTADLDDFEAIRPEAMKVMNTFTIK